jgi:hypothetical protein
LPPTMRTAADVSNQKEDFETRTRGKRWVRLRSSCVRARGGINEGDNWQWQVST